MAVIDRDADSLAILPSGVESCQADVTDPAAVAASVEKAWAGLGRIELLVNNAGVIYSEPFVNLMNPNGIMHDYGRFRANLTVNLDSVFIVTSAVAERMMKARVRGCIVNIGSISARGNEGQTAYAAAKAGVAAMSMVWAKELGRMGIRCNVVAPGFIGTDSTHAALGESIVGQIKNRTPLRRLGLAEEVAMAVASLAENDFINGATLDVNGGISL